jgi:hypothetical protein
MRYLVSQDVTYEKIWLELQALAWNNADLRGRLARVNAEWRAVLTEAFAEPHRELKIPMPLEALVSLVMTFNIGIMVERLGGIDAGHAELLEWIDQCCRADRTAERADAGALPGPRGLHRAGRGPGLLRGLRGRQTDHPPASDVVAHALAPLEDADPLPGEALPRGDVRRAG